MTTEIKYRIMRSDMRRTLSFVNELRFDYDSMEAAAAAIEAYCKAQDQTIADFFVWPMIRYWDDDKTIRVAEATNELIALRLQLPDDFGSIATAGMAEIEYAKDLKKQGKKWADREHPIPEKYQWWLR